MCYEFFKLWKLILFYLSDISSQEAHYGFKCDGCGIDPLIGLRFRCLVCPDYDLCNICKLNSTHYQHSMNRIVGREITWNHLELRNTQCHCIWEYKLAFYYQSYSFSLAQANNSDIFLHIYLNFQNAVKIIARIKLQINLMRVSNLI